MKMLMGVIVAIFLFPVLALSQSEHERQWKVLVMMSYDEVINTWEQEIKEGIDSVLASLCDVEYFYMDTKRYPEQGTQKAREAYAVYQNVRPDGVIAADDNAQNSVCDSIFKGKGEDPR